MDGVEVLRGTVRAARDLFQGTIADLTPEQANYLPPGTAHPIAEIVAHVVQAEDAIVNGMLRGEAPLWERDGWGAKLALPNVARQDEQVARAFRADVAALRPYMEAVYQSVDEYLGGLQPADLDREIAVRAGKMAVAEALSRLLVGNTLAHTGEIAAIKGIQGARGYPF